MNYPNSLQYATQASQQLLLNCYLRELGLGTWHKKESTLYTQQLLGSSAAYLLEIPVDVLQANILLEVTYRSEIGRHIFGKVWLKFDNAEEVNEVNFVLLLSLLNTSLGPESSAAEVTFEELNFVSNTLKSSQSMVSSVAEFDKRDLCKIDFIESEQNGVLGHWFHPSPKNRIGMELWQEKLYCPEFGGKFQLYYFAIDLKHFDSAGISLEGYQKYMQSCLQGDSAPVPYGYALIPTHPLQATYLKSDSYVQGLIKSGVMVEVGQMGASFYATSSVRTVYNQGLDMMMKLSIPVKITNSVRTNKAKDLEFCRLFSDVMVDVGVNDFSDQYELMLDFAYINIRNPAKLEESGFEVILRSNPFVGERACNVLNPVALFQDPILSEHSQLEYLVGLLASEGGMPIDLAAQQWFEDYVDCTLLRLIQVFDRYGVVFESHLQNCLVELRENRPFKLYSRDIEGGYILDELEDALVAKFPELAKLEGMFFEASDMYQAVAYSLLMNHIFAVVNRFGVDGLLPESLCLDLVVRMLGKLEISLGERGKKLVLHLLKSERLKCKSNLLTQFRGIDELDCSGSSAIYVEVENPLSCKSRKQRSLINAKPAY